MKLKSFFIILLSMLSLTAFAQQKKVAVYVTGKNPEIHDVFGHQLSEAFAKSNKYIATERTESFLAELNKEHNYEQSGAVDDKEIARLGIQFGVNYVCVAKISDAFGEKYIAARLIDVETAEIINSHYTKGPMTTMDQCVAMANEIAQNLSKGSFAEQKAEANEKLKKQGYVDLGLPSGTWWKKDDEFGCYTQAAASRQFGDQLPSREQIQELFENCNYEVINISSYHNYNRKDSDRNINTLKFTSKTNGESICFKTGCPIGCDGGEGRNYQGLSWSRTTFRKKIYDEYKTFAYGIEWSVIFATPQIEIKEGLSCYQGNAHLVIIPE